MNRRRFFVLLLAGPAALLGWATMRKLKHIHLRFTHSCVTHVFKDGRMWYPEIPGDRREVSRSIHQSFHHADVYVRCDDGTLWYQPEGSAMWTQVEGRVRG